jgi:hypothetical protein
VELVGIDPGNLPKGMTTVRYQPTRPLAHRAPVRPAAGPTPPLFPKEYICSHPAVTHNADVILLVIYSLDIGQPIRLGAEDSRRGVTTFTMCRNFPRLDDTALVTGKGCHDRIHTTHTGEGGIH